MKTRLVSVLVLVLFVILVSTLAVSAQGPQPPEAVRSSQPSTGYDPQIGAPLSQDGGAKSAVKSPRIAIGQPGLSFRYMQTFGVSEQAYTTDNQHLTTPGGLFIDGSNNLFVTEDQGYRMLKFNSSGSNVLALGIAGMCLTDNYSFCTPQDVSVDASGNIWVADGGSRVVEYNSSGVFQQTIPPTSSWQSGSDNTHFNWVTGIAFDNVAGLLFVSDANNHRIQVYAFSGSDPVYNATIGVTGVSGSDNTHFNQPRRLAVDSSGRLYVVDRNNNRVQRCSLSGTWSCTTFASGFNYPEGIGLDGLGNVFVADTRNSKIRKCDSGGGCADFVTGFPSWTRDVAVDSSGNVFASNPDHGTVRKYNNSGNLIGDFVGTNNVPYFVDTTRINAPSGIGLAPDGSIYLVEGSGHRLIKLNAAGAQQWTVGTAGVPGGWSSGDNTHFSGPQGSLAIDASGHVYVPDQGNNRVQVYNSDSSFYATFGSYGTDNNHLSCPAGVFVRPTGGDIYVVDRCNQRIQVFSNGWSYKATLGTTGVSGSDGTHFNNPRGVWVDGGGSVYVADSNNHRIQKCTISGTSGTCTTFIGESGVSGSDFGHLGSPESVAADTAGRFYIVDRWNNRVQVFDSSGAYLTTIGGNWGPATGDLRSPASLAVDSAGNVYVADRTNNRIQKYSPGVPGWVQTNINGFGDLINWPISLGTFGGQLYAGTWYNKTYGAQLWRSSNGKNWTAVMTNGFGNTSNNGIDHLFEFKGNLYAGVANGNGGKIFRSGDGTTWGEVTPAGLDPTNKEFLNFTSFNNRMYASTASYTTTHGAEIWSSGDGSSWTRIMSNGFNGDTNVQLVPSMTAFNGYLYATKANWNGVAQVWRCQACDGSDWAQINTDGFDGSTTDKNTVAISLASFNGYLYAGTRNWVGGTQIWRCSTCNAGSDWHQVVGPSAGTPAGFGKKTNGWVAALFVLNNELYAATYNDGNGSVSRTGMEVWRSSDGLHWRQVGFEGFGSSNNLRPLYANSIAVLNNSLYVGTYNTVTGGQVWTLFYNLMLPLVVR